MNKVLLISPAQRMMYSGIYLDLWKGNDIRQAEFSHNDDNKYQITYFDGTHRKLTSPYPKEQFLTIYWNLIQRGWKPYRHSASPL